MEHLAKFGHPDSEAAKQLAGLSLDRVTRLCNRVLADQLFQSLKVTRGSPRVCRGRPGGLCCWPQSDGWIVVHINHGLFPPPIGLACQDEWVDSLGLSCPEWVLLGGREARPALRLPLRQVPSLLSPSPKQPYFYKLMKRKWLSNPEAFATIMALLAEHAQKLRRMKLGPYQVGTGRPPPAPQPSPRSTQRLPGGPGWVSRKASGQPGLASPALPPSRPTSSSSWCPAGAGPPPSICAPDCNGGRAKSLRLPPAREKLGLRGCPQTAPSCPRGPGPLPALTSPPHPRCW